MKRYTDIKTIVDDICQVLKDTCEFDSELEMSDTLADIFCEVENQLRSSTIIQQQISAESDDSTLPDGNVR
jgi:hypothetical protein